MKDLPLCYLPVCLAPGTSKKLESSTFTES
jgi:hypothetical protein